MSKNYLSIYAKSFNWAGFFLPKKIYQKCSALYDFCRTLDNIADEDSNLKLKKEKFNKFKDDFKNKNLDNEIIQPLYDDLNTPGYIANLHKLYDKAIKGNDDDKQLFNSACNFIGLLNETKDQWLSYKKGKANIDEEEINNKIELRNLARLNKDYKEADKIRDQLLDKGVLIEDKDGKTTWKFK